MRRGQSMVPGSGNAFEVIGAVLTQLTLEQGTIRVHTRHEILWKSTETLSALFIGPSDVSAPYPTDPHYWGWYRWPNPGPVSPTAMHTLPDLRAGLRSIDA